ncbi:long-chain-fatty acid--ACP ligase MbtM [Nocardia sp. NPDC004340]
MPDLGTHIRDTLLASTKSLRTLDLLEKRWRETPWPEVAAVADTIAARLLDGDRAGERGPVGLVGDPTMETVAIMCGAWFAGRAIALLPGPVRGRANSLWADVTAEKFAALGCRELFVGTEIAQLMAAAVTDPAASVTAFPEVSAWRATPFGSIAAFSGTDTAILQGTAGSTGSPKTAVLSRAAMVRHCAGFQERIDGDPGRDIGCSWLPLYHDMGLTSLAIGMIYGGETWLAPTAAFARSPFEWLRWLSESKATLIGAPNFAYNLLGQYARRIDGVDLGNVRYAINGGEPVDCDGLARFTEEMRNFGFDPAAVAPSYGMAEATCGVSAPLPGSGLTVDEIDITEGDSARPLRTAALGSAMPGMEIRVVAGDGHPTAPGRDIGEIEVRGHSMMSGYLETEVKLAEDEWFKTGDIGYLHDGQLHVCGRSKEMLTVAGRNLFPQQVETVVGKIAGVRAGAVVATVVETANERALRRPELVVVAEFRGKGADLARDLIKESVVAECGIVPSVVELVTPGELPRTTSGKLRRLEVGRMVTEKRLKLK